MVQCPVRGTGICMDHLGLILCGVADSRRRFGINIPLRLLWRVFLWAVRVVFDNLKSASPFPSPADSVSASTGFSTVAHSVHRKRREAINPWFSKRSIIATEDFIFAQAELLCDTVQQQLQNDQVAELRVNFSAFTIDVVCGYVFGGSLGLLKDARRALEWKRTIWAIATVTPYGKQFPWILPIVMKVPTSLLRMVVPDLTRVVDLYKVRAC